MNVEYSKDSYERQLNAFNSERVYYFEMHGECITIRIWNVQCTGMNTLCLYINVSCALCIHLMFEYDFKFTCFM